MITIDLPVLYRIISHLKVLKLITFAKSLLPCKVPYSQVLGIRMLAFWEGHYSAYHTWESGKACLYFFILFFLAAQQGMQDLSSLTRDQTHVPCDGSAES